MQSNKKISSIIYTIGQSFLLNIIGVPATAYFIRALGAAGFGQWALASSLVATVSFIANLGLRTLFVRSIAQFPENVEAELSEQLGLRFLLASIASLLALLLCVILKYPPVVFWCVLLTSFGFVLSTFSAVLGDVLQGFECFKESAGIFFASGILVTAVTVIAIWQGAGPIGLSVAYLTTPILNLLLLSRLVRRRFSPIHIRWNFKRYRELLFEVRMMGMQLLLSSLNERIEQLLLPKMVGISMFGYFAAGSTLATRLVVFPDGLCTVYYPPIAEKCRTASEEVSRQVAQLLSISMVICLPIAMLVAYLASPIAQILFPRNVAVCQSVIEITIWSIPLLGLALPMVYSMQAANKHTEAARYGMTATICGCLVSIGLVKVWGITGACWSWIMRPALLVTFMLFGFMRTFPGILSHFFVGRIAVCAGIMGLLLWYSRTFPHITPILFLLGMTFSLLGYVSSLLILRVIKVEEIMLLLRRQQVNFV